MTKIILPGIALACVALYFITRKHKVEFELEIEPSGETRSDAGASAE